ncbi:MAG: UvrD-helicase domain-containing protein, partial [Fusobacteriaceae bacterium]
MSKKVVLKASAGTGKTYRLSLEYISAILKGENYKNILVMTFTKKATAEIGERVLEFLECLSSDREDEETLKKNKILKESLLNLYEDLDLSIENIIKTSKEVLENSDGMKIYTIDGFINKIFKNVIAPFLEIETYSLIDLDGEEEIMSTILEKIFSDKKSFTIFKGFLDENIEKNLDNYISLLKTILNERWKYILLKESEKMLKITGKNSIPFSVGDTRTPVEILNLISQEIEEISKIKGKDRDYYLSTFAKSYFTKDSYAKNSFLEENLFLLLEKNIWDGRYTRGKETVEIVEEMLDLTEILREKIVTEIYNNKMLPYENQVLGFIEELYRAYDEIKIKEGKLTF